MSLATSHECSLGVGLAMSQGSDFGKRLTLVALVAGLVGCAPLPIGSDSNSKSNAMVGDRLSSSQGAPLPATASSFQSRMASSQNAPLPATASAFESPIAPSQTVASAATDTPMIESSPTTRFAESRDSAGIWNNGADYRISSLDIIQVAIFQVPDLNRTVRVDERGFVSLPLIGQVQVRGMTMLQAQEDIAARYSKSYLQSPQVSLSLVKSSQRVTVSGAVKMPT